MAATGPGRDDLCPGRLILDLIDQVRGDLNRKIVFLRECTESPSHSATAGVENGGLSARQTFRQSFHERRIQKRLGMAMRVDHHCRWPIFELECVRFLRKYVIHEFFEQETTLRYALGILDL